MYTVAVYYVCIMWWSLVVDGVDSVDSVDLVHQGPHFSEQQLLGYSDAVLSTKMGA